MTLYIARKMEEKTAASNPVYRWLRNFGRIYGHEFSLIIHDAGLILFFTFLPLAYPIIYSLIYNPELVKDVPVVVIDEDRTPLSRELTRRLNACDQMKVIGYAAELGEARRAMAEGKCFGILQIPRGMENKVGLQETAPAVFYCDMALLIRYRGILIAATNVMQTLGADIMTEDIDMIAPLATTIANGDLMPIENASLGNIRSGFDSFIMPGVLMLILQQCLILAVAMSGAAKRENYRLSSYDTNMIGSGTFTAMLAQAMVYMTIIFPAALYLMHYVPLMFSFPMAGDPFEEMLFVIPFILSSIAVGFCLQTVTTERESVFLNWVVTSILFLFLSGLIWPRYAMPNFWHALSGICPSTWGLEGFIKMNANGSSLADVRSEYLSLWALVAGWWFTAWLLQKYYQRPAVFRRLAERRAVAAAINSERNETQG